jgi:hypothetical protein
MRLRRPRSNASATSNRAITPRSDAFARLRDRGRRNADAGDIGAATGCQQRVLAGAAASVEKASGQAALVSEPTKAGCGLPVSHGAGVPAV